METVFMKLNIWGLQKEVLVAVLYGDCVYKTEYIRITEGGLNNRAVWRLCLQN